MKVEIVGWPDESDLLWCKQCALGTMGRETDTPPTREWLHKILEARHSPIRELVFRYVLEVPYWVSVHLVRHHVGFQAYVQSQRNDRQNQYDRTKAPQDAPVTMRVSLNAEALMTLANKRLCMKASEETRWVVQQMCWQAEEKVPALRGLCVPMCIWNGGVCHEMQSCGRCKG